MEKTMNKPISSIDDAYYLVYFSMKNKEGEVEDADFEVVEEG